VQNQKILIIDDSLDIHELVQLGLASEPVDFISCFSGEDGLVAAATHQPDLVLLDVEMTGLDGFEVCRRLKANPLTADAPVVFLTGASTTEEKLRGLEAGATDYVFKPFDPAELRARVRASLNTKRLMDLLAQKALTLQQSEERFRVLAENSSDMICRFRPDGLCLYASPSSTVIVGYTPDELVGRTFSDFVHPDEVAAVASYFDASHGITRRGTVAFRFRKREGQYLWLESTFQALTDSRTGSIREIHASARDIEARKQMEFREQVRAHVLQMITEGRPLNDILRRLIEAAEIEEPNAIAAGVMLTGGVVHHCAPKLPSSLSSAIERHLYELVQRFGVLGAASADRIVTCDLRNDPAWRDLSPAIGELGLRSCWSILIQSSQRDSAGVFSLYRRDESKPNANTSEILKLASDLIALAVEHRQLTDQLTFQAKNDALTQLPNRALFADRLQHTLAGSTRTGRAAAVLLIDVDRFKQINDSYGHQAGDELLCQVAHRLSKRLRSCDTLARMGGDEFAVILADLSSAADAEIVAKALVEAFKRPIVLRDRETFITISVGSATCPIDGKESTLLLKNADLALYRAKDAGRNGCKAFTAEMSQGVIERMELEIALRQAIPNGELRLQYQPKVDRHGHIVGLEALARWQHPTLGLVPPGKFIPIAEDSGLIVEVGRWVLAEASRQAREWVAMGLSLIPISINVSAYEFSQPEFILSISSALEASGLAQGWLELELTETLLMLNMRDAVDKLSRLKQLQVNVAIDDFGTGYSSLAYLQRLPLDTLKVDQSFTRSIDSEIDAANGRAIIGAIVALAKSLGLSVVAEGVETESQRQFLLDVGCDVLQGYLFSAPRRAEEIELLLRKKLRGDLLLRTKCA
jgi:diguanylate cyclase (GGDEF)-like protein/PAS domain S-box-containing protein